jgi:hypothetical protein
MFHNASTLASEPRPTAKRLAWSSVLVAAAILAAGCEDKALGRPCTLITDTSVGVAQGAFEIPATDCPSRICTKPAVQPGVSNDLNTGPYCTIACNSDNDCNGQTRDFNNPNDKRCMKGFTCAIPFDPMSDARVAQVCKFTCAIPLAQGQLCCQKLCLCRDFFSASVGPATPAVCQANAGASCS